MRSQHIFTHSGTPADVNVLTNSRGKRPPFSDAESERCRPCADLRLVEQMPALAANERVKECLRRQSLYPNNKETQHAQITEFEIVAIDEASCSDAYGGKTASPRQPSTKILMSASFACLEFERAFPILNFLAG